MEFNQLKELIREVSKSKLTKFQFSDEKINISIEKKEELVVAERQGAVKRAEEFLPIESEEEGEDLSLNTVSAPLVGTFYNAPSPESEPFVRVGDRVSKGQVLGIVEAMKLMNEITSDYDGLVEKIFVENEDVVEYGQPLFAIK